jgi:hypothetical protein
MEDLYDNSRLQGKAKLPNINPNPRGIKVHVAKFNAWRQICDAEGERA